MKKVINLTEYKVKKELDKSINNIMYNKTKRERLLRDIMTKEKGKNENKES